MNIPKVANLRIMASDWYKPQALSTPSDFSEYTITDFPGYETQQ